MNNSGELDYGRNGIQTNALPTDRPTNGPTNGTTEWHIESLNATKKKKDFDFSRERAFH